jgi:hypothetical protein
MTVRTGTVTVSTLRDPTGAAVDVDTRLTALETATLAPAQQGPPGPAPAGTGFVRVTNGVLDPVVGFGTTAGTICQGTDARLADARAPLAHTHAPSDVTGTAVITSDARLSDARTPTAHTHVVTAISDSSAVGRSLLTAADAAAQRTALGLGTAATTPASAYATAAQGAKADSALQNLSPILTGSAATPATTGTMTINMTTAVITITPTGACTFNAANGGTAGQHVTFAITTSGTSSFTLTWGTNYRKTGTLATGTTSARFFAVTFVCVGSNIWQEIARTAVQT